MVMVSSNGEPNGHLGNEDTLDKEQTLTLTLHQCGDKEPRMSPLTVGW